MADNTSNINSVTEYPLETKWILWYHNPSDKNWDLNSYKDILEINSVEDFCILRNSWNLCLPKITEGMFFLMRKKDDTCIYPQWEDRHNRKGGYWSLKISKEESESVWYELIMHTIGETLTDDTYDSSNVNGISISPKKYFCILKIWNNDKKCNENKLLNTFLNKYSDSLLYTNHEDNIQKDCSKKKYWSTHNNNTNHQGNNTNHGNYNRKSNY